MRILMLTCNNSLQDGINRHILAVAPAINRLDGCEVAVCTTYSAGEFNEELEKGGVKTYALGLPNGHSLRTWSRFRHVLRDFRPDVIHAHVMGLMERPEAVTAGTVRLVGTDKNEIVSWVSRLLTDKATYESMAGVQNPYGDGMATSRILNVLFQ